MGLNEKLDELVKLIKEQEEKKKEKKFRLPFGKRVGKSQRRKNYVTVMIIYENGNVDFKKYQIDDQTILHETIPRLATSGYVMYHKKNPMVILPNWSVTPFSPLESYQASLKDGSNTVGYKLLMAKMEREKVSSKAKIGGLLKWIIGIAFVALIAYALLTGGG